MIRRRTITSYKWHVATGNETVVLLDCIKSFFRRLELLGGTEQLTTTGRNLLNIPFIDGSTRETPIQCNFENPILIHAETLPKSIQENIWRIKVVYKDNTLKYVVDSDMQKGSLFVASPENPIVSINYRGLYITEGQYEKIQVEHGVKVTPYEPYTGLKPSPSPEYPQEIKSAGKWNEGTQKYEVDVRVTGKNLLPKEIVLINNNNNDAETITYDEENHQYILQMKENNTNQVVFMFYLHLKKGIYTIRRNIIVDGVLTNKKDIAVKNANTNVSLVNKYNNYYSTFEVPEDMKVLINAGDYTGKKNKDAIIYDLQLEYGDTPTPYEPYREQTLTLTSDRPITKWDKLVEQGGEYGWLYKHRIIEDLSTLVKGNEPIYGSDGAKYFSVSLQGVSFNYDYNKIYSVAGLCPKDSKMHYVPKPMLQSVLIHVSDTDTIMTAKEHMHYKVIYETTESQFVPLSEPEQTQLRNLHSYNGTTHITVDSGEVPCGINVEYKTKS